MTTSRDKQLPGAGPADPVNRPPRGHGRHRQISPRLTDVSAVIVIVAVMAIILMIALA